MLANYFPVLIFAIIGLIAGIVFILLGTFLGPKRHYAEKDTPFECGFEAFENARMKFDVRYYLADTGAYAFWSMLVFIVVLTVGFVYEWKKGALEWE